MPRQTSMQITDATDRQAEHLKLAGFGSFTDIVRIAIDRMAQQEGHRTMNSDTYQVIEDNAGGMFLFFWRDGKMVLGLENIEHATPHDLDNITYRDANTWDSQLDDPQEVYDSITSHEFGWKVVADNRGVYPDRMGRAAEIIYGIESA